MSHYTRINCKIKNVECLKSALDEEHIAYTDVGYEIRIMNKGVQTGIRFTKDINQYYNMAAEYFRSGISVEQMQSVIQKATRNQYTLAIQNEGYTVDWVQNGRQLVGTVMVPD